MSDVTYLISYEVRAWIEADDFGEYVVFEELRMHPLGSTQACRRRVSIADVMAPDPRGALWKSVVERIEHEFAERLKEDARWRNRRPRN